MSRKAHQPKEIHETNSAFVCALKRTWCAFCQVSTIHGLKYTRDEDTNRIVRFIWILISLVMFICAIVMVHTFYINYRSSPTRMNVESDNVPVTSLYFPPVTVCPEVLFNMQKTRSYLNTITLPPNTTVQDILDRLRIFYGFMNDDERFETEDIEIMESVLLLNNLTLETLVDHMHWRCEDLFFRCRYLGDIVECAKLFQQSKTFFGHCCSFNLIQTGLKFTNMHAAGGLSYGLSIMLRYNDKDYGAIRTYSNGFKILMQDTRAFPSAHAVFKFIPFNTEVFLSVRTEETFCSIAVQALSIEERRCVFPDEFELPYLPVYVYPNCELNCRVFNMVKFCGCHTYFFNFNRTKDKICTFRQIPCLVDNFANIITRLRKTQCHCPNSCEYFDYDVQMSSADINLDIPTIDPFYDGIKKDYAVAHIFMNSQVYRRVRRDLLTNMVTLVSNLGSAFSLFVGMSMLSAVEILYYFTIILRKYYIQEIRTRQKLISHKLTKKFQLNSNGLRKISTSPINKN